MAQQLEQIYCLDFVVAVLCKLAMSSVEHAMTQVIKQVCSALMICELTRQGCKPVHWPQVPAADGPVYTRRPLAIDFGFAAQ